MMPKKDKKNRKKVETFSLEPRIIEAVKAKAIEGFGGNKSLCLNQILKEYFKIKG